MTGKQILKSGTVRDLDYHGTGAGFYDKGWITKGLLQHICKEIDAGIQHFLNHLRMEVTVSSNGNPVVNLYFEVWHAGGEKEWRFLSETPLDKVLCPAGAGTVSEGREVLKTCIDRNRKKSRFVR